MIVKTKKYKLETGTYMKIAMVNVLKEQWWVFLIAIAIACGTFIIASNWWWIGALIALTLYFIFWLIQFAGVTQMEQSKILFEKLSYEIDSRQVLIKLNAKQGMPVKWDQILSAKKGKNAFVLKVNKVQIIHLPFRIFKSDNEVKFIETILRRKGYFKEKTS